MNNDKEIDSGESPHGQELCLSSAPSHCEHVLQNKSCPASAASLRRRPRTAPFSTYPLSVRCTEHSNLSNNIPQMRTLPILVAGLDNPRKSDAADFPLV
jgi:hypothetical protein